SPHIHPLSLLAALPIFITILTGVVIPGASVGLLSLASNDVRTALFHMGEIQEALASTRERLATVERDLDAQQERLAAILAERDQAVQEMEEAVARLEEARSQLEVARESLAFQEERVKNLTRIGQDLQAHVDE